MSTHIRVLKSHIRAKSDEVKDAYEGAKLELIINRIVLLSNIVIMPKLSLTEMTKGNGEKKHQLWKQ